MMVIIYLLVFYAIVISVLVVGITLGVASWLIGFAAFLLLFSSGMWLAVREARSNASPPRTQSEE